MGTIHTLPTHKLSPEALQGLNALKVRIAGIPWLNPPEHVGIKEIIKIGKNYLAAIGVEGDVMLVLPNDSEIIEGECLIDDVEYEAFELALKCVDETYGRAVREMEMYQISEYTRQCLEPNCPWAYPDRAMSHMSEFALEILASTTEAFKEKYPKGSIVHQLPIWEAGFCPAWNSDTVLNIITPYSFVRRVTKTRLAVVKKNGKK